MLEKFGLSKVKDNGQVKPAKYNFCEDLQADISFLNGYTHHKNYLLSLYDNANNSDNGATGADQKDLVAARKFLWEGWNRIRKQYKCALENHPDEEKLINARKKAKALMIQKTERHSARCHLRLLIKRTTWGKVFKAEEG